MAGKHYAGAMKARAPQIPVSDRQSMVAVALLLGAVAGLGFAGWYVNGDALFMTLVNDTLAWCF
jgi:hypothetical protein